MRRQWTERTAAERIPLNAMSTLVIERLSENVRKAKVEFDYHNEKLAAYLSTVEVD